jgi:hypothetical protein
LFVLLYSEFLTFHFLIVLPLRPKRKGVKRGPFLRSKAHSLLVFFYLSFRKNFSFF